MLLRGSRSRTGKPILAATMTGLGITGHKDIQVGTGALIRIFHLTARIVALGEFAVVESVAVTTTARGAHEIVFW